MIIINLIQLIDILQNSPVLKVQHLTHLGGILDIYKGGELKADNIYATGHEKNSSMNEFIRMETKSLSI